MASAQSMMAELGITLPDGPAGHIRAEPGDTLEERAWKLGGSHALVGEQPVFYKGHRKAFIVKRPESLPATVWTTYLGNDGEVCEGKEEPNPLPLNPEDWPQKLRQEYCDGYDRFVDGW